MDSHCDGGGSTLAVNIWWRGPGALMAEHMQPYYLRRLLVRQVEREKEEQMQPQLAHSSPSGPGSASGAGAGAAAIDSAGAATAASDKQLEDDRLLDVLFPRSLASSQDAKDGKEGKAAAASSAAAPTAAVPHDFASATRALQLLDPRGFQRVFLRAAATRPEQLRQFVLQMPPVCAALVTALMESLEEELQDVEQTEAFFAELYRPFASSEEAVDALLAKNEQFAKQAFVSVLRKVAGWED